MAVDIACLSFHHGGDGRVLAPARCQHDARHKTGQRKYLVKAFQAFNRSVAYADAAKDIILVDCCRVQLVIIKIQGRSARDFAAVQRRDNQNAVIIICSLVISACA